VTIDTLSLADDTAGISLGTLNDMGGAAELSLTAWIRATSFAAGDPGAIFAKTSSTGTVGPWKLQIQDGGVGLRFILNTSVGGDASITDATVFATGTDYFVAGIYNGVTMKTFVNAVETASAAKTGTVQSNANNARLGGVDPGSGAFRRKFNGRLDDLRIYTRGLSLAELETMYAARGHDAIKNGLLHRWLVKEAAPGVVGIVPIVDSAAGQFNGTPIFGPVYRESILSPRRRYL
jgi:hypothetical protein